MPRPRPEAETSMRNEKKERMIGPLSELKSGNRYRDEAINEMPAIAPAIPGMSSMRRCLIWLAEASTRSISMRAISGSGTRGNIGESKVE